MNYWVSENRHKSNDLNGYYGVTKGIVTRNILYLPKPYIESKIDKYGTVVDTNNKWDVQVWIPALDVDETLPMEPDLYKVGSADDYGKYPWAQVCGPLFKDQIGTDKTDYEDTWSSMFSGKKLQDVPSTYPAIGDIVFIMFENGMKTKPICIGSLMCDRNAVRYHDTEQSGNFDDYDLNSRVTGYKT